MRLKELSENDGTPAHLLDDKRELQDGWFEDVNTVLVTAGASAPDDLVRGVIDELVARFDGTIDESELVKEDVTFALPVQLRILKHEMSQ